jgi:membrane protease YdiL (CAAX protease family)
MFDWSLWLVLMVICIPGILFLIPTTRIIYKSIKERLPSGKKIPSENGFIIISIVQTLVFVAIAAAFGIAVNYETNLHAPFLEALANNQRLWSALKPQIIASLVVGIGGGIIFLLGYYFIFRSRLDKQTIRCMENLRMSVGIWGRVFYGGIVEEVICRWGLMAFFVWVGILLFGEAKSLIYWTSILIAGLLFGVAHLPGYLSSGCKKSSNFITLVIGLNLWASIIFGWLFWHYGLCAAIIAHALFHIIWYLFDLYFQRKQLEEIIELSAINNV